VPHLFLVTIREPDGTASSYEVQTFLGRDKAISIGSDVHAAHGKVVAGVMVTEIGPTEPGGSSTAYDDRAEW
jgi:hypothetical protein